MNVAKGVETLELTMDMMGYHTKIYPTLLWDKETVILVDAGLATSLSEIQKAMGQTGVPFSDLNKIIITHQDLDQLAAYQKC